MAEENYEPQHNRRTDQLRSIQQNIDATLNYYSRTPETSDEEAEQRQGIRSDVEKLIDRLRDFNRELE